MNRVKFVLKRLWYKPKVLEETRKINKEKFNNQDKKNHMKIIKRHYHYSNPKPNMEPNKNNLILLGVSLLCIDHFYNRYN